MIIETDGICDDYELLHSTNSSWYTIGQEGKETWYVAQGKITMNNTTLTVRGSVNIILCDGANVRIMDGIEVKTGYSLTIYSQEKENGKLYAENNYGDAGIGGGDDSSYMVGLDTQGEILIGAPVTVTFDAGEGSGSMEDVSFISGETYALPSCSFTAPDGKEFKAWSVVIGSGEAKEKQPDETIRVTADTVVTAVWEDLTEPVFRTHTLLLSGQIGVNFYVDMSMLTQAEREASTMEFTVNGKTSTDTFDADFLNPNTEKYYGFTCYINSVQMADEITAELHFTQNGEEKTISQKYSAAEYVNLVLENQDRFPGNAVALVRAMADYGHYVQTFLAHSNQWTIGVDHAEMAGVNEFTETEVAEAEAAVADKAIVKDPGDSQIEKVTYSLNLDSETAIRIYLKVKDGYTGNVTAVMGGNPVDCVKQKDGRYRIEISGISAHKLGDVYNVTVTADGTCTVNDSALSYVNTVLASDSELFRTEEARFAVTSVYRYYAAAQAYRNNPNE